MTKYLGMSDIFIIFVSRKGNNRYKRLKKSKKIFGYFNILLYICIVRRNY